MPLALELPWMVVVVVATIVGFAKYFMDILKDILSTFCVRSFNTHVDVLCALVATVVN